jgi:hypothetical protein
MSAWSVLIANSTAPNGSIAWLHLNSQAGGTSTLQIFAELEVELMPDLEAVLEPELQAILEPELTAELEPELAAEVE